MVEEEGTFDAVVMLQLIEHVEDPVAIARRVFALLRPGGIFVVETPNLAGFDYRLFRGRWWGHYHFPRHWNLFSRDSLERMLRGAGFAIERSRGADQHVARGRSRSGNYFLDRGYPGWFARFFNYKNPLLLAIFVALDTVCSRLGRETSNQRDRAQLSAVISANGSRAPASTSRCRCGAARSRAAARRAASARRSRARPCETRRPTTRPRRGEPIAQAEEAPEPRKRLAAAALGTVDHDQAAWSRVPVEHADVVPGNLEPLPFRKRAVGSRTTSPGRARGPDRASARTSSPGARSCRAGASRRGRAARARSGSSIRPTRTRRRARDAAGRSAGPRAARSPDTARPDCRDRPDLRNGVSARPRPRARGRAVSGTR